MTEPIMLEGETLLVRVGYDTVRSPSPSWSSSMRLPSPFMTG